MKSSSVNLDAAYYPSVCTCHFQLTLVRQRSVLCGHSACSPDDFAHARLLGGCMLGRLLLLRLALQDVHDCRRCGFPHHCSRSCCSSRSSSILRAQQYDHLMRHWASHSPAGHAQCSSCCQALTTKTDSVTASKPDTSKPVIFDSLSEASSAEHSSLGHQTALSLK